MEKVAKKSSFYDVIERIFSIGIPGAMVVVMGAMITMEILGRLIVNRSWQGLVDMTENLVVLLAFLSLAAVQAERSHITVDILYEKLKHRRIGAVLDCIALGIGIVVMSFVFGELVWYCVRARITGMTTVTLFWPVWPFALGLVIGALLFIFRMALQFKESFLKVLTFRKPDVTQPERIRDLEKEEI